MVTFNVSSYGAVFGTGQSTATQKANKTAVRDACTAAIAAAAGGAEVEVVIDTSGTLEFYIDNTTDAVAMDVGGTRVMMARLAPVGAMTVRGLSAATHLAMFPDGPTYDYVAFYVDEYLATRNITFKDITLDGPSNFGVNDPTADYNRTFIQHQGTLTPGHHPRSSLVIDNVVQTGACHGGPNSNSGDIDITITNCNITALFSTVNIFNQGSCAKIVHITDTTTHTTYDASAQSVGLYLHPNITTRIERCQLQTHRRYAVYFNGTPTAPVPQYVEVTGCTITGGGAFLQSNCLTTTVVRGNTSTVGAAKAQVVAFGPIEVYDNNVLTGGSIEAANGPHGTGEHAHLLVHHNTFIGLSGDGTGATVVGANQWTHHNTFTFNNTQWAAISSDFAIAGDHCLVEYNQLNGTFKGLIVSYDTHGDVTLRHNTINPAGIGRAIYGIGGSAISTPSLVMVLEHNDFNEHAMMFYYYRPNRVSGNDNIVCVSMPVDFSGGDITPQAIHNRTGVSPSSVVAATNVSLNPNYNEVVVSGNTTITNLYLGGNAGQNGTFLGQYKLTLTGSPIISNTGNIVPLSVGARQPGSTVLISWDPVISKWVEYRQTHTRTHTIQGFRESFSRGGWIRRSGKF